MEVGPVVVEVRSVIGVTIAVAITAMEGRRHTIAAAAERMTAVKRRTATQAAMAAVETAAAKAAATAKPTAAMTTAAAPDFSGQCIGRGFRCRSRAGT